MTHIAVASEVLKQLDFSQGALGQDLLAKNIGDLLDGDALTSLTIGSSANVIRMKDVTLVKLLAVDDSDGGQTYQTIPYAP